MASHVFEHIVSGNFTDLRDNQRGIVVDLSGKMYTVSYHTMVAVEQRIPLPAKSS